MSDQPDRASAGPHLGSAMESVLGWTWLLDVTINGKIIPVAFSLDQAREMHRRLGDALDFST